MASHEYQKRLGEINLIIDKYKENHRIKFDGHELDFIENAAEKICDAYFNLLENAIRPYLKDGAFANKYKVAAGSEIACMNVLPILCQGESYANRKRINAVFALFLATTFLFSISYDTIKLNKDKNYLHGKAFSILKGHFYWLLSLDCRGEKFLSTPTYLNSNFWECYHSFCETIFIIS